MNQRARAPHPGAVLLPLVCALPPREGHALGSLLSRSLGGTFLQRTCSARFSPSCTRILSLTLGRVSCHSPTVIEVIC